MAVLEEFAWGFTTVCPVSTDTNWIRGSYCTCAPVPGDLSLTLAKAGECLPQIKV